MLMGGAGDLCTFIYFLYCIIIATVAILRVIMRFGRVQFSEGEGG